MIISPSEIAAKASKAYPRFLRQWIRGEGEAFFPWKVRAKLSPDFKQPAAVIQAVDTLMAGSKESLGWGYTVHRERRRSRDFGSNDFPVGITIDTRDDLLRLAKAVNDFSATANVTNQLRRELPGLESWLRKHVRTLASLESLCDGLIRVTHFFLNNPRPDCFARQIPVSVDTKFIDRNHTILHQWLDELLPAAAIDVNEKKFARRFGLRDGDTHRGIRFLDTVLAKETGFPFEELSLPLRHIADLSIQDATVFIVENDLNLLTLPRFRRGVGLRGEGNAVGRLGRVGWLAENTVYYWGDIDVEGFFILSQLRSRLPGVKSLMMDLAAAHAHSRFAGPGTGTSLSAPTNLTIDELGAYEFCVTHNFRVEQEKILQQYVEKTFLGIEQPMRFAAFTDSGEASSRSMVANK
ncbi:hypothetical protein GYB59_01310 [bacterium]|nr:hypothetical protein [bacterium]